MPHPHPHPEMNDNNLFRKIVLACLVPLGWIVLGILCYYYSTDLSKKAGAALIFIGIVSLVYNLVRVRRRHADKKKSLHL
jgi:hypothetical protein